VGVPVVVAVGVSVAVVVGVSLAVGVLVGVFVGVAVGVLVGVGGGGHGMSVDQCWPAPPLRGLSTPGLVLPAASVMIVPAPSSKR
jgi:hypothetical protein